MFGEDPNTPPDGDSPSEGEAWRSSTAEFRPAIENPYPWVTYGTIALCVTICGFLNLSGQSPGSLSLLQTLAPDAYRIWLRETPWALITAAFVHVQIWHVFFNMWMTRDFGRILEPRIGTPKFFVFTILSAAVGAGVQLATSDQTGIGFSGVIYAYFGLMLALRDTDPIYKRLLHSRNISILIGWLFLCVILTKLNVLPIANGAHFGGLAFGYLLGLGKVRKRLAILYPIGAILLLLGAVTAAFYAPWSTAWNERHLAAEYFQIEKNAAQGDPQAQCIYGTALLQYQPREDEGVRYLEAAIQKGNVMAMNNLAWRMATDPRPKVRNGAEALKLSRQACEKDSWSTAGYIDTVAAAYAELNQWADAIAMEQYAIQVAYEKGDKESVKNLQPTLENYRRGKKVAEFDERK